MKYLLLVLAALGIAASSMALREHYRDDLSPCSINAHWDCGIVNHSPFALIAGVPVADIGILGYSILGVFALRRYFRLMLVACVAALSFSLYLAHVERDILGVWCVYCVASLVVISLMTLLVLGTVIARQIRAPRSAAP